MPTDLRTIELRGNVARMFGSAAREIILDGPAGTGKSLGILTKIHDILMEHPGARWAMLRKTRRSLTQSGMKTYENLINPASDGVRFNTTEQEYKYPNGSGLIVGGLDDPTKLFSTEFDGFYVQEAIEIDEADWESMFRSLRNGRMDYVQAIGDTNPGPPTHWIRQRAARGKLNLWRTRHEDNPRFFDRTGHITPDGEQYVSILDELTGTRYLRLRSGLWVAAEGAVYEDVWNRDLHLIPRFEIPADWPRYLSIDFGFTNPFVCQWWAADPDGRLYRYREIYHTKRLVSDHGEQIRELSKGEPKPRKIVADHDAEDRATLERVLGWTVTPAKKSVSDGLQATAQRMKPAKDGKPRIYFLQDSLVERDPALDERKLPACTEEEVDGYAWDTSNGRKRGEEPVKRDDHGLDTTRYIVAEHDLQRRTLRVG